MKRSAPPTIALLYGLFLSSGPAPVSAQTTPVFLDEWTGFQSPVALALSPVGDVYVLDAGCPCVKKFAYDGTLLGTWGSLGGGSGQFQIPTDLSVDEAGFVYVADRGNERVQRFDANGAFVDEWGSPGLDAGEFDELRSISVASDGTVFTLDGSEGRVQQFDGQGRFVQEWPAWLDSGAPRQIDSPTDHILIPQRIELNAAGTVDISYLGFGVSDVIRFDRAGNSLGSVGSPSPGYYWAFGVGSDPTGKTYTTDLGQDRVFVLDPSSRLLAAWGSEGDGPGKFRDPADAAGTSDGIIYVVDTGNRRVQKFDAGSVRVQIMTWGRVKADRR